MENVKTKVFLGYFTLVILASLIVWIIYSEIVTGPGQKADLTPANRKIMYINTVLTNLYQLEGFGRNYAQTGLIKHYREYQNLMDTISLQIETLSRMENNPVQQMHTDSIKKLLAMKHENLKELSSIKKANSPAARYEQAIEKLSSGRDSIEKMTIAADTTGQQMKINKTVTTNYDSVYVKQKKKKFFERLAGVFSAKQQKDSALYVSVNQTIQLDSLINAANPADSIANYFTTIIEEIRDENVVIEKQLKQKEREVLENDLIITVQLRKMLSNIENAELLSSFQRIKAQEEKIRQTTWLIIILGALSLITIIFFLFNILEDLTKSKHYRQRLEKANAYSESLLRSKEQFMLSITHDLKSPLSSIIGFAGLIQENTSDPKQLKYLHHIRKASDHILRLINDLLDLARLDSGKLKIESIPFNLKSLVTDTVENLRPQALEKGIMLTYEYNAASAGYKSDPLRITQILVNLISNAIKFTDEGSVTVRVSTEKYTSKIDQVSIEVIDTGIGIPREKIHHIFEEFGRVTSPLKQYEGTGLGLTITRKMAELLHGSVHVKSTPGKGSHFNVLLPLTKEALVAAAEAVPTAVTPISHGHQKHLQGKRVWLVDDDPAILEMTARVLETAGMKVFAYSHPLEAVGEFRKGCADFLITDIQMPGINGFEVIKQVRDRNGADLPMIAMSGQEIEAGRLDAFTTFVQKPFTPQVLIAALSGQMKEKNCSVTLPAKTLTAGSRPKQYSLDQISAFASGEAESLRQILLTFVQSGKENAMIFRRYMTEKNNHAISELSHKMLPLFRQLEAYEIVELLSRLEKKRPEAGKEEWHAECVSALVKIEELLSAIQREEGLPAHS
ncbi:MAG: hybrid sensor histidine kinase/response regulator [Prolixibacteraceae bacterium]